MHLNSNIETLLFFKNRGLNMNISVCGLVCNECQFFEGACQGCYAVEGKTFWAGEVMPEKVCPIFDCAINEKKYINCGDCSDLPCNIFNELKDPNITEEEHEKSLKTRTKTLK